jgi:hypothetical protein
MPSFRLREDERRLFIAKLANVFPAEELYLQNGEPAVGSFLDRIRQAEFWRESLEDAQQGGPQHSAQFGATTPAIEFYLAYCFGSDYVATLENCFSICARSFHESRRDPDALRDILLFFLYQNFDFLIHLFLLRQPQFRTLPASAEALQSCFGAPQIAELLTGRQVADWVLREWLPGRLRAHYQRARA